jgi:hypothetical protein
MNRGLMPIILRLSKNMTPKGSWDDGKTEEAYALLWRWISLRALASEPHNSGCHIAKPFPSLNRYISSASWTQDCLGKLWGMRIYG